MNRIPPSIAVPFVWLLTLAQGCALGVQDEDELAPPGFQQPQEDPGDQPTGQPPSCPEVACDAGQFCASGICATQTETACLNGPFNLDDGCGQDAMCHDFLFVNDQVLEADGCYAFPPCGEDWSCPVGPYGAVCSFGVIEDKSPMCVPGLCLAAEHCPPSFSCVKAQDFDVYGHCTDGRPGAACGAGSDCVSGVCDAVAPTVIGRCI